MNCQLSAAGIGFLQQFITHVPLTLSVFPVYVCVCVGICWQIVAQRANECEKCKLFNEHFNL